MNLTLTEAVSYLSYDLFFKFFMHLYYHEVLKPQFEKQDMIG